jgi:PAS domain S-box-containing protein
MSLHVAVYQVVLAVACLLCLGVATYAWRNRERRGAKLLVGVLVFVIVWAVMAGLVSVFSGTAVAIYAARTWFVGITGSVMFLFLLALEYTGRDEYITRRNVGLLLVEPVLANVAVWVPPFRQHFVRFGGLDPTTFYGYAVDSGVLFYAHTLYSYVLITATAVMFIGFALRSESLYQRQITAILVAVFAPWVGNILYIFGPLTVDLTPLAFAVTGLSLWWAIFIEDFLDILPIARTSVVDNIGAGVFVLDRNNRVVDINPTGRELMGLQDSPVIGRDAIALLSQMPAVQERFESVADTDEVVEGEVSFGANHFSVQMTPLTDRTGDIIGRLFMVNDVTDQKRRQRELEHKNEKLENFASVVSHDLRNPLNVAAGNLQLGREQGDDELLEDAEQALDRMDAIIDDVLTLAREGRTIDEVGRVSLEAVASEAWRHVEARAATLSVTGDRAFEADEMRLQRVFENLFRNALEHGGEEVTVGPTDDGFFVADDGPGIPESERDQVFEAGFTTNDKGTGFGLAIVQSIVEAHGWTVSVTESESGGARFDVSDIPPVADEPPGSARAEDTPSSARPPDE